MATRDELVQELKRQIEDVVPENRELTEEDAANLGAIDLDEVLDEMDSEAEAEDEEPEEEIKG